MNYQVSMASLSASFLLLRLPFLHICKFWGACFDIKSQINSLHGAARSLRRNIQSKTWPNSYKISSLLIKVWPKFAVAWPRRVPSCRVVSRVFAPVLVSCLLRTDLCNKTISFTGDQHLSNFCPNGLIVFSASSSR